MIQQLAWREPLWLLLAIIPWLFWIWRSLPASWTPRFALPRHLHIRVRRNKKASTQQERRAAFADLHLWPHLMTERNNTKLPSWWNTSIWIVAWTLAALAASGPYIQKQTPDTTGQGHGIDIAVVIDISPSMSVQDIAPNRLERAKRELRDFVSRLHGDRVALIAFSANAYITLPLTPDKETFLHFTDLLDPGLVIKHGSNIARALLVARQALEGAEQPNDTKGRAIILMTDGETHNSAAASAEVNTLRAMGIPLFIVGMGTEAGGPVPDGKGHFMKVNNELVVSRLARTALISLANKTGGLYVDLYNDDSEWQQLFTQLGKLEPARYHQDIATQNYQLFPWLIGISLLLFLWTGARHGTAALLAWVMILPLITLPEHAHAAPWEEQRALDALKKNDYAQATLLYRGIKSFNGLMGFGASAYRQRQWDVALVAFKQASRNANSDAERAQASYNTGNALTQLNRLDEAAHAYETALTWQKNYPRAALNLTLVQKEKELRALALSKGGKIGDSKKTLALNASIHADDAQGRAQAKGSASAVGERSEGSRMPGAAKNETFQVRQQMQALHENAQELLRNRFSAADKFSGVLVIEDEKPW